MKIISDKFLATILGTEVRIVNQTMKRNNVNIEKVVPKSSGYPIKYYSESEAIKFIYTYKRRSIGKPEKEMEDWIKERLDLIEPGLTLVKQQFWLTYRHRVDLLLKNKKSHPVIIELQVGELDRHHLYKTLEYRDLYHIKNKVKPQVILLVEDVCSDYRDICELHGLELKVMNFNIAKTTVVKRPDQQIKVEELVQRLKDNLEDL